MHRRSTPFAFAASRAPRSRRASLERSDRELLATRVGDLELSIETSVFAPRVARLHAELEARAIFHRPHVWFSTSWFSPDGVPGIAIPFYLAHPRLQRLYSRYVGDAEGGDARSAAKLLRHEAGHAIDTAYRLHAKKGWRDTFGPFSARYATDYAPRPFRREFVLHLDAWYAQSHAAEDFAETFAVWLDPRSNWRVRYGDWPAIEKLEYVDAALEALAGAPAPLATRDECWPLEEFDFTLERFLVSERARREVERKRSVDRWLLRTFERAEPRAQRSVARTFARLQRELERRAGDASFEERYTLEQVLRTLVQRAHELGLTVDAGDVKARLDTLLELGHIVMRSLRSGRHEFVR